MSAESLLLKQTEVARLLGVHPETIRKLIAAGHLETVRLSPNSHQYVRRADVEAIIAGAGRTP